MLLLFSGFNKGCSGLTVAQHSWMKQALSLFYLGAVGCKPAADLHQNEKFRILRFSL